MEHKIYERLKALNLSIITMIRWSEIISKIEQMLLSKLTMTPVPSCLLLTTVLTKGHNNIQLDRMFRHTMLLRCRSRGTEVVHPKKYRVSWRYPPVTHNINMQTKLPLCEGYRFAVFKKNVSTTNARCWVPHCSMTTETAKPYASNGTPSMTTGRSAFVY